MENEIVEQPQEQTQSATAQEENEGLETDGSIGKFKNSEALLAAYNNLQSEFTKKCQTLSNLQKEQEGNKQNLPPCFKEDFNDKLNSFMSENPKAKKYESAIINMILSDKSVGSAHNPLESAWNKIAKENITEPAELIKDEDFVNKFILTDEQIKQKIINDYFSKINFETSPPLIAAHTGSKSAVTPAKKPQNIAEAGEAARGLFD